MEVGHTSDNASVASTSTNSVRSRHSSIEGPYREGVTKETGFPFCLLRPTPAHVLLNYSRSMLSSGHGCPLLDPVGGDLPMKHFQKGIGIGDVGHLGANGDFKYYFNIFHSSTDEIQHKYLPPNFESLGPLEIQESPSHFFPGTTIVSEGITVLSTSKSPLKIRFQTSALEGGVIILPNGGSREDLRDSSALLPYVKKHALDWYRFMTDYSDPKALPNGTLYLVTGCDRADSWATAAFPAREKDAGMELQFDYNSEGSRPWSTNDAVRGRSDSAANHGVSRGTFFIRGLRIALSSWTWSLHLPIISPNRVEFYQILSTAVQGYQTKLIRLKHKIFGSPKIDRARRLPIPFHPSNLILQLMLKKCPEAGVAVVHDDVWCDAMDGGYLSYQHLTLLLSRIFDDHAVMNLDGVAALTPKTTECKGRRIAALDFVSKAKKIRQQERILQDAVLFLASP